MVVFHDMIAMPSIVLRATCVNRNIPNISFQIDGTPPDDDRDWTAALSHMSAILRPSESGYG